MEPEQRTSIPSGATRNSNNLNYINTQQQQQQQQQHQQQKQRTRTTNHGNPKHYKNHNNNARQSRSGPTNNQESEVSKEKRSRQFLVGLVFIVVVLSLPLVVLWSFLEHSTTKTYHLNMNKLSYFGFVLFWVVSVVSLFDSLCCLWCLLFFLNNKPHQ